MPSSIPLSARTLLHVSLLFPSAPSSLPRLVSLSARTIPNRHVSLTESQEVAAFAIFGGVAGMFLAMARYRSIAEKSQDTQRVVSTFRMRCQDLHADFSAKSWDPSRIKMY